MVTMRSFINSLALIFFFSTSAQAQELTPVNFSGRYDFTLAAVPFGKIDIVFKQDATSYSATSDITTVGIAKVFVQHESHTTSKGTGADYQYPDVDYDSRYSTKGKKRVATFTRRNGVMTAEFVEPPDNPAVRPPVSAALKTRAYDPVALAIGMRGELARVIRSGEKNFTIDYYDGRRLTRGNFTYTGEKLLKMNGTKYPVYTVLASRSPVAGFTEKELKRMQQKEPPLTIYLAKDTLLPLRLELPLMFGKAAATLRI